MSSRRPTSVRGRTRSSRPVRYASMVLFELLRAPHVCFFPSTRFQVCHYERRLRAGRGGAGAAGQAFRGCRRHADSLFLLPVGISNGRGGPLPIGGLLAPRQAVKRSPRLRKLVNPSLGALTSFRLSALAGGFLPREPPCPSPGEPRPPLPLPLAESPSSSLEVILSPFHGGRV